MPDGLELLDRLQQLLHDERRESEGELVDDEHLGVVEQRPCERHHLLLATRQRGCGLTGALAQTREEARAPGRSGRSCRHDPAGR